MLNGLTMSRIKHTTSTYITKDSINARPMIIVVVIGPEAPGLRAMPSKALRMPRACEKAPPIAAMARPNAALAATIPKYRNSASDFLTASAASATELKTTSTTTTANPSHASFLRIQIPPFARFSGRHLSVCGLMMLLFRHGDVDHRQQHEHKSLDETHENPQEHNW